MSRQMTPDELAFAKRMVPHMMAGKSFEDAARAVLDDDKRLFNAFCDRSHQQYVPTADERGYSFTTRERPGDVMVREMAKAVYTACRAK